MLYNKNNLNVAKIAAKDGYKDELKAVMFTRKKTVATDGFRLLEVSVDTGANAAEFPKVDGKAAMLGFSTFLASAKDTQRVKIPKNKTGLPILDYAAIKHVDDTHVEFLTTDVQTVSVMSAARMSGTFPEYEKIFPQGEPVAEVIINAELLAELLEVMGQLKQTVKIKFYGKEKPLMLECGTASQRARGLIMPVKV